MSAAVCIVALMTQTNYIIGGEDRAFRHPIYLRESGELIGFAEMDVSTKRWRGFLAVGGQAKEYDTLQDAAAGVFDTWLWDTL